MSVVARVLAGMVAVLLATVPVVGAAADPVSRTGRRTYEGAIDGARYRVELPERWNGTLVLYSHGYYLPEFAPEEVLLANREETVTWLLDHGYAVAASEYADGGFGYAVEEGVRDQRALLDWFDEHVGKPRRTVSSGVSQGGVIAALLAERQPHRFAGTVAVSGEFDTPGSWNTALDVAFVVRTLLAPDEDIELVRASRPEESAQALASAVREARSTAEGRARLALAGAVGNVPTWYSAFEEQPTELTERILAQSTWVEYAYSLGLGPVGRVDLEARTGGNPSWNTGIDYGRQLARSRHRQVVRAAYAAAPGADLRADLASLAGADRVTADPEAVAYMYRHGLAEGSAPTPTITVHTTGDGGALADQVRWLAGQAARHGDPGRFRQTYVARGGHCTLTAAEEIVTLQAMFHRVESGHWPSLAPPRLDARATDLGPEYQLLTDHETGEDHTVSPAYTRYLPPRFLRPSR